MGNCMETCLPRSSEEAQEEVQGDQLETTMTFSTYPQKQMPGSADEVQDGVLNGRSGDKKVSEIGKGDGGGGSVRVKIVLTKEELQWLMMQLKSDGEKRLENMLEEIEMRRKKVTTSDDGCGKKCIAGWKPSLESIMETPEVLEMDRSMRL